MSIRPRFTRSIRPKPLIMAGALAVALLAGMLGTPPAIASDRVVVVRAGETLSGIAARHGTTVERLVELNHLADPNRIYVGQRIRVRSAQGSAGGPAPRKRLVLHRVVYGETLTGIAIRYRTTIDVLVARNRLADPSRIYAGQVLRISSHHQARRPHQRPHDSRGPSRPTQEPRSVIHVVRAGETVSGIAVRYRVTQDAIVRANRLANPSFIRTGQQLRIPGARHPRHGRRHPTSHAGPSMPPSMAAVVSQRSAMRKLIAREARRQGFPTSLALAVAWQESGWQAGVVSSAGAIGVLQLLPATADWVSATILHERVNLWDARSNVRAGIALLKHYLARYGNRPMALAAYYQGQAGTDRYGIYPISRGYVASILMLQRLFRG
jgi:LysM repeat protein